MAATLDPRALWAIVQPCEVCGRRARASHLIRFWASRPQPTVDDAELMTVESTGNRGLRNKRTPLWPTLAATPEQPANGDTRRMLTDYYDALERRLLAAAKAAKAGAQRARYGP